MKHVMLMIAVIVAAVIAAPQASAGFAGDVNFFLGQKSLDSDDWKPIDDQVEFGAVMSFGADDWPVRIAADVLTSVEEKDVNGFGGNVTLTGVTFELAGGVRKIWQNGNVRPYLGAGVGVIGAALELDNGIATIDANDATLGFWAGTGVFFRLGSNFNIGADVRFSTAKVDLDFGAGNIARDVNVGGLHYGMLLGFGW
jgi:hypothetical protein